MTSTAPWPTPSRWWASAGRCWSSGSSSTARSATRNLAHGLPGIGTNILAARLKDLESGGGIVEKRKLPPPTPVTVYELTEYGAGLEEALYALARWGARSLGPPKNEDDLYAEWGLNALPAVFNREEARGLTATYVFKIDDDVFTARRDRRQLEPTLGAADDADLVVETDAETFFLLCLRRARAAGRARVGRIAGDGRRVAARALLPRVHVRAAIPRAA